MGKIAKFCLAMFVGALWCQPALALSEGAVKKKLSTALKRKDRTAVTEALDEAAALPGTKGAKLLLSKALPIGVMGLIEDLVSALSKVKDASPVIKAAKSHKTPDIRYICVRALGQVDSKEALEACIKALKDKAEVVVVSAVRVTQTKPTKALVDQWIAMLLKEEKAKEKKRRAALMRELVTALKNVTGQELEAGIDWENYWKSHGGEWKAPENETGTGKDDVIDRMRKHRKSDVKTLERLARTDVIVMRGRSDKVETVLAGLKIEHKRINRDEFGSLKLEPSSVLVLNCNGNKDLFSDAELKKISQFVAKGGYLFTSDWQLKFTVEKAFPGSIGFMGESKRTDKGKETSGPIFPTLPNHPYMRDVFPLSTLEQAGYRWKIDGRSHLVKILARKGVFPLIRCPLLAKEHKAPYVAVTFRWNGKVVSKTRVATGGKERPEGGAVLHVLGHFKNQQDKSDKFALQQLLLNFVLEKQREKRTK